MSALAQCLLDSLRTAPLLVERLDAFESFDRSDFRSAERSSDLNFDQKLGHLYEDALAQAFERSVRYQVCARNLQVHDAEGRTLGEFDYLIQDQSDGSVIHLELAVKFYLCVQTASGWQYPGPDPRDNWQRKLEHLRGHQLLLAQRPESRALLKERFHIESIEVQQLIYGALFRPLSGQDCPFPETISPNARVGHWLRISEWTTYFSECLDDEVLLIPKVLWPVPLDASKRDLLEPISIQQLIERAEDRCVLFCFPNAPEVMYFLAWDQWFTE